MKWKISQKTLNLINQQMSVIQKQKFWTHKVNLNKLKDYLNFISYTFISFSSFQLE